MLTFADFKATEKKVTARELEKIHGIMEGDHEDDVDYYVYQDGLYLYRYNGEGEFMTHISNWQYEGNKTSVIWQLYKFYLEEHEGFDICETQALDIVLENPLNKIGFYQYCTAYNVYPIQHDVEGPNGWPVYSIEGIYEDVKRWLVEQYGLNEREAVEYIIPEAT
jgi:hypothetical protein